MAAATIATVGAPEAPWAGAQGATPRITLQMTARSTIRLALVAGRRASTPTSCRAAPQAGAAPESSQLAGGEAQQLRRSGQEVVGVVEQAPEVRRLPMRGEGLVVGPPLEHGEAGRRALQAAHGVGDVSAFGARGRHRRLQEVLDAVDVVLGRGEQGHDFEFGHGCERMDASSPGETGAGCDVTMARCPSSVACAMPWPSPTS